MNRPATRSQTLQERLDEYGPYRNSKGQLVPFPSYKRPKEEVILKKGLFLRRVLNLDQTFTEDECVLTLTNFRLQENSDEEDGYHYTFIDDPLHIAFLCKPGSETTSSGSFVMNGYVEFVPLDEPKGHSLGSSKKPSGMKRTIEWVSAITDTYAKLH